tara:strand:+ start:46 stop:354 length:309 start_codon:yes stop_codon:yes gene_type:complete
MTKTNNNLYSGIPQPITQLTTEQDFKMRQIELALNNPDVEIEDIKTVFLALQKQNFVLANSVMNLIKQWPKVMITDPPTTEEGKRKYGILLEIKDSTSTSET